MTEVEDVQEQVDDPILPSNATRREEILWELDSAIVAANKAKIALGNRVEHHHVMERMNEAKTHLHMAASTFQSTIKAAANAALDHRDEVEQ